MPKATICDTFDGGNIELIAAESNNSDGDGVRLSLAIRKDNAADFYQWFYFRLEGQIGQQYTLCIDNAAGAAYPKGWQNYQVCASYDRQSWFRTPTRFDNNRLLFSFTLEQSSVYFAYFAPYSYERHLDLLAWAEADARVTNQYLGRTLDGRALQVLQVGQTSTPKHTVWVIARQHPGETMAEWFVEGLLHALLDQDKPLACRLLENTVFYVVPNMNPDGSVRGNLRTNASGANLNREWADPSMTRSPEVFLVREKMMETGGDIFLDIHGDEALPYNFVAGSEGTPNFSSRISALQDCFKAAFVSVSPDFQTQQGYPIAAAGAADLRMATNWLANHFKTLAFTLEMPFKDNADLPRPMTGWSPERSIQLGQDILFPISETLKLTRKNEPRSE